MLEQILVFLLSLAVAAAGVTGLEIASSAPHGVGSPEIATATAALARQHAAEQLAGALERAQLASEEEAEGEDEEEQLDSTGLETAAGAITQAMESAPEAAEVGLQNAFTHVTALVGGPETGDGDLPDGVPPVSVPVGPPAELPDGPPADAPSGRP